MARREGREFRVEFDAGSERRLQVLRALQDELECRTVTETMRRILDILGELPPGVLARLPVLLAQVPQPSPALDHTAPLVPAQQGSGGRFRL